MVKIGSSISEDWLLEVLVTARKAIDAEYRLVAEAPQSSVDYDHYVYLRVPRRQRRIWRLLRTLSKAHDWISPSERSDVLDINPSFKGPSPFSKNAEYRAARAAAAVLSDAGIAAYVDEHWR